MVTAELSGDGRIAVDISFHEKDLVRAIPGSLWSATRKTWTVPLSWGSCKALRGVFKDRLDIGPDLAAWAYAERSQRIDPCLQLRTALDAPGPDHLYPFQRAGVRFLVTAGQALLADEMGVGKTVQTITALRELQDTKGDAFPAIVIAPNTVKLNWKREWARWDPSVEVIVIGGSLKERQRQFSIARELIGVGHDVVVAINWEGTRGHSRISGYGNVHLSEKDRQDKELNLLGAQTVIVDEAHRMMNPRTQQTRAVWAIQHGDTVKYRFSLTGTPISSHPGELWSIMHGVAPEDYPRRSSYIDRYCLQTWNPFGVLDIVGVRPDTREEFYAILEPRMRRMSKDLVLQFLPKKVRQTRYVEMGPKQRKAYHDLETSMVTKLDDGSIMMTTNNLTLNTRLLQFSSAYAEVTVDPNTHEQLVRMSEPSPKLDAMLEVIEDLEGESLVVAAESRQLIELAALRLEKNGITFRKIVGGMTAEERQVNIDDFQAGRARVMLMTLQAGGVGVTLTKAPAILFLQRSWSMILNRQGEDRIHRIGSEQHDKILVIDLITQGTIEETQVPRLQQKLGRLQEIVRDIDVARTAGNAEAIARLEAELSVLESTPLWAQATA